jgi:hypothetical protein
VRQRRIGDRLNVPEPLFQGQRVCTNCHLGAS